MHTTDAWTGMYSDSWNGLMVSEAFSHPAKFSKSLIFHIIKHAIAEGFLATGQTVLDVFAGVSLSALPCLLHGIGWIGIELEERFVQLGKQNLGLWARRYGHTPQYRAPVIICGDSRQLVALLQGQAASCVIASPPFADSLQPVNPAIDAKLATAKAQGRTAARATWGANKGSSGMSGDVYSANPHNLGNLPPGTPPGALAGTLGAGAGADCVVSSPPYEGSEITDHRSTINNTLRGIGPASRKRGGDITRSMGCYATEGTLGNTSGPTFWEASRTILQQVHAVLKPGGVAIWVVKSYIRDKEVVDFPGDWARLCVSCGFELLHEHHALLVEEHGTQGGLFGTDTVHRTERKSFFRRLAEKRPGAPRIDFETILCMRKLTSSAP